MPGTTVKGAPFSVLLRLIGQQYLGRMRRTAERLRSPRRIFPTLLVLIPAVILIPNFIAAAVLRAAAPSEQIALWLSGGLAFYAIFHLVRAGWQEPEFNFGLTPAQQLWLGGAPIPRSSLIAYKASIVLVPTLIKASMLCVIMARDTPQPWLTALAIFGALLALELVRMLIFTIASGCHGRSLVYLRLLGTGLAIAVVSQVLLRTVQQWPGGWDHAAPVRLVKLIFASIGTTASDSTMQTLALPFQPFATLAIAERFDGSCWLAMLGIVVLFGTLFKAILIADRRANAACLLNEQKQLAAYRSGLKTTKKRTKRTHTARLRTLPFWGGAGPLMARQLVTLRRYRTAVFISLALPGLLSLLPVFLGTWGTGTILDVVGGLAFYTLLLAPPALKLDFRRDIESMVSLASMPLTPLRMLIGQIALPVLLTLVFQTVVIGIALVARPTSILQTCFWMTTLAGTAVFAFALENALFLTFPHRLKQEGIEMFVRAKLVFVGKSCLWISATVMLGLWAMFCAHFVPPGFRLPILSAGVLGLVWGLALLMLWFAARSWRRFDTSSDLPA